MARRHTDSVRVAVAPDQLFAALDDPARLGAHMTRRTWMMGGGRMAYAMDDRRGQAVGSHIRMTGSAFGYALYVDEVVTVYEPPTRKCWETRGAVRLLILQGYAMGFEIAAESTGSLLEVWIEYAPRWSRGLRASLTSWLCDAYARWCVQRMLHDAAAVGTIVHPRPSR